MFIYDSENEELTICKVDVPEPSTVYEASEMYESYEKYRDHGLAEDIQEVLIPELNRVMTGSSIKEKIWVEDIQIREQRNSVREYSNYLAMVKLGGIGISEIAKEFCIFKLPYMDKFGVLERDGKKYAVISELVQDDDITYNNGELKIVTKLGCFVNLEGRSEKPKVKFRDKKLSAVDVLFALAIREGIDKESLFEKLVSKDALTLRNNEKTYAYSMEYGAYEDKVQRYVDALYADAYDLSTVRDKINDTLSLDRAEGKKLFRNINLSTGEVIESETIITSSILKKIKRDGVNEIYVEDIPNMVGYYTVSNIYLPVLRRGTFLHESIRDKFPDNRGDYLEKDILFGDNPLVIPANTMVTKGFLEMLAYNGHTDVVLKNSVTSSVATVVPVEVSIIGNRCFKKSDLGISNSDEYVYMDEDGNVSEPPSHLTAYDMLAMLSLYERLSKGLDFNVIANIDMGLRKKVNMANELFHKAFRFATAEFVNTVKMKLSNSYNGSKELFGNAESMENIFIGLSYKWWRALYKRMKVIQRIEQDNPVAYYSSFAKINSIVKDKNSITRGQRGMSMGHYGRLCPYETPSGKTMGIVSNKATGCKIINGVMTTSYYRVKHFGGKSFIDMTPVWLSVKEEEKYRIADIASLRLGPTVNKGSGSSREILSHDRVLARIPAPSGLEKMTISYIDIDKVELVNTDPNQTDGLPATTIPFQGANDAARVIFGIGMAKQAKGLVDAEIPIVGTSGFKRIPRKSTYYMICAEYDGEVEDVTDGSILMYYPEVNIHRSYEYKISEYDNATVVIRRAVVELGDKVKAGDVLVESNFTKNGYLVTGINCLVAYVPEGYNYEDGIYGSMRLAERMVSYGAQSETVNVPRKFNTPKTGVINKFKYKKKGSRLCDIAYNISGNKIVIPCYSKKLKGFLVNTKMLWDATGKDGVKGIRFDAVAFNPLNQGDKLANRHGNKGVTPRIIDNNDMPMFLNGEFADLAYNPMGVGSRMNIGQILECNLGLACMVLQIRSMSDSFNGAQERDIKLLLSYAWDLANCDDPDVVTTNPMYSELPEALHEHSVLNIDKIKNWAGAFNKDGTAKMFNPTTGRYFETPVLVGVNYVYKLVHEAAKKEHARAGLCTEPYVEKLSSPTKGASNSGGQRYGYMELDALAAYGANAIIHEVLNERGDNPVARNNMTVEYLHKYDDFKLNESTSMRRSTEYFVNIAEALGVHQDFEGELPNNTKFNNEMRQVYKVHELMTRTSDINNAKSKPITMKDLADNIGSIL